MSKMKPEINENGVKDLLALFIISCLLLTILLPGCSQAPPQTQPPPGPSVTEPAPPTPSSPQVEPPPASATPEPAPPASSSYGGTPVISVSKAPRVGETVEVQLTWDIVYALQHPVNKVWVEFERYDPAVFYPAGRAPRREQALQVLSEKTEPLSAYFLDALKSQPETIIPHERVAVEGSLVWQGAPLKVGDKVQLKGKVRYPEEGEWVVYCRYQAEGKYPLSYGAIRLTVGEESGSFGWPKDQSQGIYRANPTENAPIAVTLKPGRAPLLGEPLDVTVVIQSIRDVPEGEVYLRLFRQEGSFRNKDADYRLEGDLSWRGSLKKDVPVELTGKVFFNEEGDWAIQAWSRTPEAIAGGSLGGANMYNIYLHVGKESSRYGWTGSEGPQSPPPQGTPTPAPPPEPKPASEG